MLDPKMRAEMDQARATLCETFPPLWAAMHERLKECFSEQQAWELLRIHVFAMSGGKGMLG